MNQQAVIEALADIKIQAEMIPILNDKRSSTNWLVNNQRKWIVIKVEALIAAIREDTDGLQ